MLICQSVDPVQSHCQYCERFILQAVLGEKHEPLAESVEVQLFTSSQGFPFWWLMVVSN